MSLKPEIKDFVKKILLLSLVLSFFINLLVLYISAGTGGTASADSNDALYARVGSKYLGTTAVALSFNIGTALTERKSTPVELASDAASLGLALSDKGVAQTRIVSANMVALQAYYNVLKTNVPSLLDESRDRAAMLESFIDQLRSRASDSQDRVRVLQSQMSQLQSAVSTSNAAIESMKSQLQSAYANLDYDKTEEIIKSYLDERQKNTYAKTYLVFLARFVATYQALDAYERKLVSTLEANRDPLVKRATVVLPSTGTDLLKNLRLIETEAEAQSRR